MTRGDIPEKAPSSSVLTDEMIRRSYTVRSEEEGNQKPAISGQ